jgi:ribonuclease D
MKINVVENSRGIDDFNSLIGSQTEISVDIEGDRLCRHGCINLIQIYMPQVETVFIFDCKVLDLKVLKNSLRPALNSESVTKYMFDCRSDVDALYHQYDISLCKVIDVQLYEVGFRKCTGNQSSYYKGLYATLCEHGTDIGIERSDLEIKKTVGDRFKNKNYNMNLNDEEIIKYLCIDVAYLHKLYSKFRPKIGSGNIYKKILKETNARENIWKTPIFITDSSRARSVI